MKLRQPRILLACLLVMLVSWGLLLAGGSIINVTIREGAGTLAAVVNGTTLAVPPDELSKQSQQADRAIAFATPRPGPTDGPSGSTYWQEAQAGLFEAVGRIGEALQSLRPTSYWREDPNDKQQGAVHTYNWQLVRGRTSARLEVHEVAPSEVTYVLVVHAEGRTITWLKQTPGAEDVQLDRDYYRPGGWASMSDLLDELLLGSFWAAAICLLAWLAGALALALSGRGETKAAVQVPQSAVVRAFGMGYAPPVALFLAGTLLSAVAAVYVLDGIPHVQDEVGYLFQGRIFALARSAVPVPPHPEFFTNGFIQMFEGKWFAKYPPGYPLLLVPGFLVGVPWLINPLCMGASLALIYASGLRMFGQRVAVWAGLLGLVSPWVIFMSGSYMSHPSTMMWSSLLLYALVRNKTDVATGRKRLHTVFWPLLAGAALGMAFITRQWTAAGLGVGAAIWALGDILGSRQGERRTAFLRYLAVVAGFLPPLSIILYENRQLTGDVLRFTQDLVGSYDVPGFGPGHGDALGHTPALGVYNALVYVRSLATVLNGWPPVLALVPLLLAPLAPLATRGRKWSWDALLWLLFAGLVGAYFVWWSATTVYGPRYWYEAMPALLLLSGRGLDVLGSLAGRGLGSPDTAKLRWAVPAALIGPMLVYSLSQSIPAGVRTYTDYNGISAAPLRAAEGAGLHNALIFTQLDPAKPNRDYGKVFSANDPLLKGDRIYARDLGAARNRDLPASFPGRKVYWLPLHGPPVPGFGP